MQVRITAVYELTDRDGSQLNPGKQEALHRKCLASVLKASQAVFNDLRDHVHGETGLNIDLLDMVVGEHEEDASGHSE